MTNQVIPAEAIEAAAKVLLADESGREVSELDGEIWADDIEAFMDLARSVLEAAAPHMLGSALEEAADEIIVPGPGRAASATWLRERAEQMRATK